ncbi:UvrABC system protein B [Mesomycoplasma conjunctivae]|uniref:UvrABC system protein B n=1 Tax=Mesomycoplasma conjunctivae (strain ATCC 25834 / NCTC 10147 / HRC/581) TaxID=572263 RepID=C5J5I9_MESCH|nr:excinuclease ABC subunit UvrB [Mesomycoplasma conjunctivae]CAT04712.1 UvrABC system protein B [Mesomycoplasma conjunctivae]VEU65700.1 UvrABC system protein B [Mesomycoplasma conjunctivae]
MFKLVSKYAPSGDQPKAISSLVNGIKNNKENQVLLGVTGSGKTFTMANVISQINRPVLVLSHNKTLASQLYSEFKEFFPENRVEYFVSNFDFYRPEAYLPGKDIYVDKTSKTNMDLEAMRMSALNALSMRNDTIVVSSVAAIYGALNPTEYKEGFLNIEANQKIKIQNLAINLVKIGYQRNNIDLKPGNFSIKGDILELAPAWDDSFNIRISFFGDLIESIDTIHPIEKKLFRSFHAYTIYPASAYTVKRDTITQAIKTIEIELEYRLKYFENEGKLVEKQRLEERVNNDIDSLREFGFCSGIENYARHIDGRQEGEKPYTLLDYLPKDALIFIDESHIMVPQLNGMYEGDRSRKTNLVDYGFRLPSALDNRPLKFKEFEKYEQQKIFVSATPGQYELDLVDGEVIPQIIRPTGLLDPIIEVVDKTNQMEKIYNYLQQQKAKDERSLILTTTKRLSEEISKYLQEEKKQKVYYIHSDFTTFERDEILIKLRKGVYDAVIGINLLREGVDLPEVSLILVLDADHESFFRSRSSLIQIAGRAARNDHGKVIFFADKISRSMKEVIEDNKNKREIQIKYNIENNITPKTIIKPIPQRLNPKTEMSISRIIKKDKGNKKEIKSHIEDLRNEMKKAAANHNFELAIEIRDLIAELEQKI